MANKVKNYYDIASLDGYNAQYYMIFGGRSNGKSFSVTRRALDNFFNYGEEFIICKRYEEDIKSKTASTMLKNQEDYILEEYGYKIKFYHGKWYAYKDGESDKLKDCRLMGHTMSINNSDRLKGGQYPNVTTIILEEFMSMSCTYLPDEINMFINLVSTVARHRTNIKVYLLGNAISKSSPYSTALGVKLHRMKKGEIIHKEFTDNLGNKTSFVIQRTENVQIDENEDGNRTVYNIFGDSGVGNMITTGEFEHAKYLRECNNVTFNELISELPKIKGVKRRVFNKQDKVNLIIKYEDYYYQTYLKDGVIPILGFRELKEINVKDTTFLLTNENIYIKNCYNIKNIKTFTFGGEAINKLLDKVVQTLYQGNVVFFTDDNGQDVYNAFRMCGMSDLL